MVRLINSLLYQWYIAISTAVKYTNQAVIQLFSFPKHIVCIIHTAKSTSSCHVVSSFAINQIEAEAFLIRVRRYQEKQRLDRNLHRGLGPKTHHYSRGPFEH